MAQAVMEIFEPTALKRLVDSAGELHLDNYWEVVKYNCELFSFELWLEGLRQWFVIIATLILNMLLFFSLLNLRRTQRGCDID